MTNPAWFAIMVMSGFIGFGCESLDMSREFSLSSWQIINGEPDTDPAHQGVVALLTSSGFVFCSGAVIAPRVVITEAHCVYQSEPASVFVGIGPDATAGVRLGVDEIFVHPDHAVGSDTEPSVHDLALLILSEPVAADVPVLALLPEELKLGPVDIGLPVTFVGYGRTESQGTGIRMKADGILGWMCTAEGGCNQGPLRVSQNSICFNMHDAGTCNGDSGGPAFVLRNGREYIAGMTSYGDTNCELFGCDTKVDEYHDWIDGVVSTILGSACSTGADCDSGNCKDGVCCESACDGACFSCAIAGSFGDCVQLPDGQPCPDENLCNGDEICFGGVCQPGGMENCDDSNPCTNDECDEISGCSHVRLPDQSICDDSDLCLGIGRCVAGFCEFEKAQECDDNNECTEDSCEPATGCRFEPLADGTVCNAGVCGKANCINAQCLVTEPIDCDDGNSCTKDFCDPDIGCMAEQASDGTPCGECGVCVCGECDSSACKATCGCSQDSSDTNLFLLLLLLFLLAYVNQSSGKKGREGRG